MNNKKIYIILFAILYLCVALVSTIHAISFFGLANASPLAIILAIAFEVGQAAVLFSILTDSNQQKRVMPWVLMSILTLVQVMGNVYNSYRYLILNSEDGLRFFKEPIFVWTQIPDNVANVILSYIIGAILPIVSLLMTAMVTGFLNKKEEKLVEEVKEEPKINLETGEITPAKFGPHGNHYMPIKEEVKEEPKINLETEEIILPSHTPSHKDYFMPEKSKEEIIPPHVFSPSKEYYIPETKEEIVDEEPDDNPEDKANDEYIANIEESLPKNEEGEIIGEDMNSNGSLIGEEGESGTEEKEIEFPHEIVQEDSKKSHFVNL